MVKHLLIEIIKNISLLIFYIILIISLSFGEQNEKNNSPYVLSNDLDLTIATIGSGLLLGSMLIDYKPLSIKDISILNSETIPNYDNKAIDNWSISSIKRSDILLYSSIVLPGFLLIDKKVRRDYYNFSILWAESILLTAGITNIVKVLVKRPRPYLYGDKASTDYKQNEDNRKSFFSGHTSISAVSCFLLASMYDDYNPAGELSPYLWFGAYTIPALTAYYRYDAGKHFLSDVVIGYIVGRAIGLSVPKLHTGEGKMNIGVTLQTDGRIKSSFSYRF